ncbi:MAG: sporulation protein YunB [Oscillospiraceae bacterium]|nr:MAG: sporulation protein YunB [Oscillospiraceae bacterium]
MAFCGLQKQKNEKRRRFAKIVVFALFLLLSCVLIYNLQILPVLFPLAKAKCTTELTDAVNRIVRARMQSDSDGYADFVRLHFGEDGSVASVETNTPRLAKLSGDVVGDVTDALTHERMTVRIPLGSLSGSALLSGKGPDVRVKLAVSQKITCAVRGDFTESGINQTLHRVFLRVTVEVCALLPGAVQTFSVPTDVCVAETVIIGKVPEAYTRIDRFASDVTETEIDDISDYGAQGQLRNLP